MTLYEFWLLIVKRWKLLVIVAAVCGVACSAYLVLFSGSGGSEVSYTATSRIIVNSQVQAVSGLAASEGRQYLARLYGDQAVDESNSDEAESNEFKITTRGDSNSMTVTITATGPDADACVQAATVVAEAAENSAEATFASVAELPYVGKVEPAMLSDPDDAKGSGNSSIKYLIVAILGGLFIAICIAVVLDRTRRPVKTLEGIQKAVELPVLETLPAANGERLLANVRFASRRDDLSSVYVVPVGDAEVASAACDLLARMSASERGRALNVECGKPLSSSMRAAYESRSYDAVVVTARQWRDSLSQLESTVAELKLAEANLVGIVFAKEKLS